MVINLTANSSKNREKKNINIKIMVINLAANSSKNREKIRIEPLLLTQFKFLEWE